MLKHILDTKPKYKEIMDALIDNPNPDLKKIIQPIINTELEKARMIGIEIGWSSAFIQAYEKIKDIQTINEAKACLRDEADKTRKKLGLKSAFDKDGNLIIEEEEQDEE